MRPLATRWPPNRRLVDNTMQNTRPYTAGAFTMVELIVVMLVLAIAAGIMVPMMGNTHAMELRAAAQHVASTLTYAQNSAIAARAPIQVVFSPDAESYSLQDADGQVLTGDVTTDDSRFQTTFPDTYDYSSVTIETADFDDTQSVWFDRLGSPHSGAIADAPPHLASGQLVLASGESTVTIAVAPVTGNITVN